MNGRLRPNFRTIWFVGGGLFSVFFFNDTATTEIYTLSLHDALPICSGEVDILVGTQMVTKGHDLPRVTLVGVINADASLSMPDFRAAERGFQLLVQVAGRAGRSDRPGTVLIQTRDPENPAIVFAARHDVRGFVEREMVDREEGPYPPFARLAMIRLDGPEE